jgi:hypothetical protein
MISLETINKDKSFQHWLKKMPHVAQDIVETGINAAASAVANHIPSATESEWNVSFKDLVKQKIEMQQSGTWISANISYKGKKVPFIKLNPNPNTPETDKRSGGISVEIKRGETYQFRNKFIVRMPTGHVGVFTRTGRVKEIPGKKSGFIERETIEELYTISVPEMITSNSTGITEQSLELAQIAFDNATTMAITEWQKTLRR